MKMRIVFALIILGAAYGEQTAALERSKAKAPRWSTAERDAVQRNCESAVTNSSTQFSGNYAAVYCDCLFEIITSRWSPSEVEQQELGIIETLANEGVVAKCLQAAGAANAAEDLLRAKAASMPVDILGVRLAMSMEELRATRPGALKIDGTLSERAIWKKHEFEVSYSIDPISRTVVMISLEHRSNQASFADMQSELNDDFGPLPTPAAEGGWLLKSARTAGGVVITHGLRADESGVLTEAVFLAKDYGEFRRH